MIDVLSLHDSPMKDFFYIILKAFLELHPSYLLSIQRSAFHSVQPIELNFSEGSSIMSPSNTIEISMDCITMHGTEEHLAVSVTKQLTLQTKCLHSLLSGPATELLVS